MNSYGNVLRKVFFSLYLPFKTPSRESYYNFTAPPKKNKNFQILYSTQRRQSVPEGANPIFMQIKKIIYIGCSLTQTANGVYDKRYYFRLQCNFDYKRVAHPFEHFTWSRNVTWINVDTKFHVAREKTKSTCMMTVKKD